MTGITKRMLERVTASIAEAKDDEVVPLEGMGGYYVSRKNEVPNLRHLFSVPVDGTETHVYIRLEGLAEK